MRLRPTLTLLLLASTALSQTPAKRPMTFADLQSMKRIGDPQISPSGKWVLFSVTETSLENNTAATHLWLVPLVGGKETQLTKASAESNGRFSPDGKSISFSHKNQIWLAPFDDATGTLGDDHAITALETGADGALWAPDSKHILFTSSVFPECESKEPPDLQHNQEEADCNAQKDAIADKSPVKAQVWEDLLYRHWNGYVGRKRSHIFYASTELYNNKPIAPTDLTPASVIGDHVAPTFSLGGPLGYAISPDGKEIAYEVNLDKVPAESTNNDIFTLQIGAAPATARKVSTSPGSDDGPQYSPDGKYLAWRSQARAGFESDKFDLVLLDRATREVKNLTPKFFTWVSEFAWAGSDRLLIVAPYGGNTSTQAISVDGKFGDTLNPLDRNPRGEYSDIKPLRDGQSMVAVRTALDSPSAIVRVENTLESGTTDNGFYHLLGTKFEPLTHLNDAVLAPLDLSRLESFKFAGANNTQVEGFLIRPPNFDQTKKYPLKFLIHGGPQGAWGDAWSYRWNPELFAANGYVVVMINPRGSTGYGQKFVDEVSGDWGGRPYIDLMKGLDYAEKTYPFIDKTRECALGGSYGGFMANYILTHTNRFACIVSHDGMYNPQSAFGTTEELWFNEWEFRPLAHPKNLSSRPKAAGRSGETPVLSDADAGDATSAGRPQDAGDATVEETTPAHPWDFYNLPANQDPFRKFSPMLAIDNARTPTLVIHGQLDYRLDVSEALQLFTALQLRHVPSKMLYFPDEGHWVLKPQNSQLWYNTVNDWVDQWTHTNSYADKAK